MPYNSAGTFRASTLADACYRAAREIGALTEGVATGGSVTTIVDTRTLTHADDFFNEGIAIIVRDSAETGVAPEGQFGHITDFTASTDTATIGSLSAGSGDPFTAAVAAGDRYALTTGKYPAHQIVAAVNGALQDVGMVVRFDTTTLDTAAAQTEFSTVPIAAAIGLRRVYIQGRTGDANDNRWIEIRNWKLRASAFLGAAATLELPFQYPAGRDIMLEYVQEHPEMNNAADEMGESIHLNLVSSMAALRLLLYRAQRAGNNDPALNDQIKRQKQQVELMRLHYPIYVPPAHSNVLILGPRLAEQRFRINP